jgi:serine protease Do
MRMTPAVLASRARSALLVGCAVAAATLAPAAEPAGARAAPSSFAPALARTLASIVGVYASVESPEFPGARPGRRTDATVEVDDDVHGSIGAGFAIDSSGLVVTAAHVVAGSTRIALKLPDRRVVAAEVAGIDSENDIALLKTGVALPLPPFGRSSALRPGDWVLAVGEPYGFSRSVSAGIVGGTGRHVADEPELLFIQSDLALNPGNSGGPLLDASGAIVGMNSRTMIGGVGAVGVSLSLPIEIVVQIVAELREPGAVDRPRLGATFQDVSPPAALRAGRSHSQGALIGEVSGGGVGARIGLERGDIVVGMNGRAIGDSAELARALLAWRSLSDTSITVWRRGRFEELRLD